MLISKISKMKTWKFVAILLIIDIILGITIYQQQNSVNTEEHSGCENGQGYAIYGVRWSSFPIYYYIQNTLNEYLDIIERSINIWNHVTDTILFEETNNRNQANLQIFFGQTPDYYVLGQTFLYYESQNSIYIDHATITLSDSHQFTELDFSCDIIDGYTAIVFDLQSIIIHELGHVLGLAHSDDFYNTMFFSYIGTFQKTLSQGDIDGLLSIYENLAPSD